VLNQRKRVLRRDDGGFNDWEERVEGHAYDAKRLAVVIVDVGDTHIHDRFRHWCAEKAPKIDVFARSMRALGATIIHASAGVMGYYEQHPARLRAQAKGIGLAHQLSWHARVWRARRAVRRGRFPSPPFAQGYDGPSVQAVNARRTGGRTRQHAAILIDEERDYISDSAPEIFGIICNGGSSSQFSQVLYVGGYLSGCVMWRPFGLHVATTCGIPCLVVRDLSDIVMYSAEQPPYVSYDHALRLYLSFLEARVCPTIDSADCVKPLEP